MGARKIDFELLAGASCLLPAAGQPTPAAFPPAFAPAGVINDPAPHDAGHAVATPPLTPAEQRVLTLLLAGLANKEIATALGRAEATVKNQVQGCLRKHGVPTRTRLIALLKQ